MEIHFADPELVPAAFVSLASALQSSGVDFNTVRNCSIPATEIWLAYPLNHRKEALLSYAAHVGEQQTARVAVQAGSPRGQINNHDSINTPQELIWEARNSREHSKENRERTS
jgi:hypothetical protein